MDVNVPYGINQNGCHSHSVTDFQKLWSPQTIASLWVGAPHSLTFMKIKIVLRGLCKNVLLHLKDAPKY